MANQEPPSAPRGRRPPPVIEGEATEIGGAGTAGKTGAQGGAGAWRDRFRLRGVFPAWLSSPFSWNWSRPFGGRLAGAAPLLVAAAIGAAAAVIVVLIAGVLSSRDERIAVLQTRIARLEQQLKEASDRAPATTAAVDTSRAEDKRLDDLAARLGKLENAPASRPAADPALAGRLTAAERQLKSVTDDLVALKRRTDELAAAPAASPAPDTSSEVDALKSRIAALEQREKSVAEAVQRPPADVDAAARRAFAAQALQSAVDRGAPFTTELGTARSLAPDADALKPLEPFAATGVPRAPVLAEQLSALLPALAEAAGTAPGGDSFLSKLQSHAEKLVRIRPIDEVPGDDPAAVLARLELKTTRNDLAGALAELDKLPEPARAKAAAWAEKARAPLAAVEASRRFAADALTALSK